ncbi:MAG: ubiquitin-like protein [Promethearchaeota archaeon]
MSAEERTEERAEERAELIRKYGAETESDPTGDKPETPEPVKSPHYLEIKVINQNGSAIHFKLKETTPFQKMFNAYLKRNNLATSSVRFLYDGKRLNNKDTPKSVGMEDDDIVDVVLQQTGGE